jgi:hypothetical protein
MSTEPKGDVGGKFCRKCGLLNGSCDRPDCPDRRQA